MLRDESELHPVARAEMRLDLVFAGHGVFLPEKGVDDYAGLDVGGKAVVDKDKCDECKICIEVCPVWAIVLE